MSTQKQEDIAPDVVGLVQQTIVVKNLTDNELRFCILDDAPSMYTSPKAAGAGVVQHARMPLVELDDTRTDKDGMPLPKLHGPKKQVRQRREHHVRIAPKQSVRLPISALPSLVKLRCEVCAKPTCGLGCAHLDDPEHRATWTIVAGGLVSLDQVQIDFLHDVPLNSATRDELEANAKASPLNHWGRDLPR